MKKNINARLILSFSLLILTFVLFDLIVVYDIQTISGLTQTIHDHPLVVSNAALQSNACIAKMHRSMKDVVLFDDPGQVSAAIKAVDIEEQEVYRHLDIVRSRILGNRGKRFEQEARQLFEDWRPIREEVIGLVRDNQRRKAAEITREKGAAHVALLEEKMLGLTRYARDKASAFMATSDRTRTRIIFTSLSFLVLAIMVSGLIAWFTLTWVSSAEQQLDRSRVLLVNAIDDASIGMVMVSPGGKFYRANSSFCNMIGYSEEELCRMHFQDITHPEDHDIGQKVVKDMTNRESGRVSFEKRYIRKDGDVVQAQVFSTLLRDDKDTPLYFFTQIHDITEQKKAENALRESEEKYKVLFRASSDALILVDVETLRIVDVNEKAVEQYGYDYDTLLTLRAPDLSAEPEKTKTTIRRDHGTAVPKRLHRKKDGTVFPVEITANYFVWKGRKTNISSLRDISQIKKIEMRLNQAQKMEALGTLAGGIAHDFNNILTAIIGYAELTVAEMDRQGKAAGDIREIIMASQRAKELVNQILAFARQSDEVLGPVRVDKILDEVLRLIRSTIPSTIEITSQLHSQARIMGNDSQLHQVFMNLFTNAAHAMELSGGLLSVALVDRTVVRKKEDSSLNPGDYVEIKISDTGPGIAPDIIDLVFEPYFTTKAPGEGTGLGLSVVHGIVESYGGKISVISTPNVSTLFTIYLPVVNQLAESAEPVEEALMGTEHILFVDDETTIIKISGRILEDLGYRVTACTSSTEALDQFRASPGEFDLVITDMTMPRMPGDILARNMMEIRQDIPVILCTGFSRRITEETVAKMGVSAFLFKPVIKAELAGTIRKVLDKSQGDPAHA